MSEYQNGYRPMSEAPRDGTQIQVARYNGCGWEYDVVWWTVHSKYPWSSEGNAYVDDRFDAWRHLQPPYEVSE
ncbi:MAG: hypothetical protein FD152_778 [Xanthobacteraceae bacterium]|nr:MAG: hypothetical protein FD152_778 [Xanthobacteraceae bacterium]